MQQGTIGAIIGALIAAAWVQWGFLSLIFVLIFAGLGFVVDRYLGPRKSELIDWFKSGQRALQRKN